jgi:hypothetical protein
MPIPRWRRNKTFPLNQFPLTFSGMFNAVLKAPQQVGFAVNRVAGTNHHWKLPFTVEDYEDDVYFQAVMYLTALFFGCMLCHGELVKLKPAPKHLTQYYLLISAGGTWAACSWPSSAHPCLFARTSCT